jgi:hypothetical protein
MMWKWFALTAAAIFALDSLASAQSPRFSGAWDSQTNPGVVWRIDQADSGVKVSIVVRNKQVRTTEWLFDGPPADQLISGFSAQTVARLDGEFLSFSGPIVLKDASIPASVQETWRLSTTGDELIVDTKISSPATTFSRQQTFNRQK